MIGRLTRFLSELGAVFAFVGRQYKITAGEHDYFLDLLFFHLGLRRFVVFELKVGQAEPEHIGKLNFYVDVVEYALRGIDSPLAVSTYTTYRALPNDIRPSLPTTDDLVHALRDVPRQ